ncbi:MAG: hypothetical protein ROZ09_06995 [Thiobacillus sp.]|uniref:hypothetical protein n=1 Tax=Thiobacillus sp. TaxID=924 RepID=UPI00289615A3|nr:hypothetical protein [Thiobacillus sp.]MDT3706559.1 hypothetical protein [Thiobacillus sp.]
MKTWIITLPFLCAVGVATAQGVEKEGGVDRPEAAAAEPIVVPTEISPAAIPAEPATLDNAQTPVKAKARSKAKTAGKTTSKARMGTRGPKTLPRGDVRHCLDLKSRAQIIRCAETGRKK